MEQLAQARFGAWLKHRRKSNRLTQEDLAERLVCSSVLVQKIEAGERTPSAQVSSLIAIWLGIPKDQHAAFLSFARGQLDFDKADAMFSSARSTRFSGPNNLRTPLTRLIGRADELQIVERLISGEEARLLTLTGPPG